MYRFGAVSFLNSAPLTSGLGRRPDVELMFDVPARLAGALDSGVVDVALIPVVDILRSSGGYAPLSDACIGCDGETMTVRVFAQVPPDRITRLTVDGDSHTSVALATVVWRELYGRELQITPLEAGEAGREQAVLLIGDKVVSPSRGQFAFEVDLGGVWREITGLPFVFALWARRAQNDAFDVDGAARALSAARDEGLANLVRIAREAGPAKGWPAALAERYLTRCLRFTVDSRMREGVERFAALCRQAGLAPHDSRIVWPDNAATQLGAGATQA